MATQPTMDEILEYGLISEFSYLTLESQYFQTANLKDGKVSYDSNTIKEYLQATEQQIETALGSNDVIIPKDQQSLIEKVESNIPFYDEGFVESTDVYRDIQTDRVDEMMGINERYEVLEFKSDPNTDLQIMLLQNKQTGKYVIASRGTASTTDVQVDTDMAANVNSQYQPALEFTVGVMNKYQINVENLVFVGHSLGGTTANMLGIATGADAYSYNPYGAYNIYTGEVFGVDPNVDLETAKEHCFIISYQDKGDVNGDILSNYATSINGNQHVGTVIPIFGENVGLGDGHSIVTMNKANETRAVIYKEFYSDYVNGGNEPLNFDTWLKQEQGNLSTLDGGYAKIVQYKLPDSDNEIYLVKNENGNYDKYELIPDSYNQNGEVTAYNLKAYDSEGNLTYSYDANESYELKITQNGENLTLTKLPVIDTSNIVTGDIRIPTAIPLTQGQTISHIAANTDYTSIDLLEYNNLTLEEAKNLPVGFEVQIPKDITEIQTPQGNIKIYEGYDETGVVLQPDNTRIQYDENSDMLIYGNNDKITFTDTNGIYQELSKDTDGNIYKSLEVNNNYSISYDSQNNTTDIQIYGDNISLEDIANLTPYSKEDLQAFNFLDGDTIDADTNFSLPATKEENIQGGYGDITHFTTKEGNDLFVVPQEDKSTITYSTFTDGFENQAYYEKNSNGSMDILLSNSDGSTRVIIANSDGYSFDSYGLENKVDFTYMQNENGDRVVSGFTLKNETSFQELVDSGAIPDDAVAFANLNQMGSVFDTETLQSGSYKIPDPENTFSIDETDTQVYRSIDGDYVVKMGDEIYTSKNTSQGRVYEYIDSNRNTTLYRTDENGVDQEISFTTSDGEKFASREKYISYKESTGSQYGSAIGGQIGSLIISNNEYSNIERVAISTVSTVAVQNIGEYIALEQNGLDGSEAYNDIGGDTIKIGAGAITSFLVSSYFAKNDNVSDLLGIDGTFLGDYMDYEAVQGITFIAKELITTGTVNWANFNPTTIVGGYLGNALANEIMDWDTKEEVTGATIGSTITTIALTEVIGTLMMMGPVGWIAAAVVTIFGSALGNIIGGIIGGLFGGDEPTPTAHSNFEFDEETLTYALLSSSSADGGNEAAMVSIGESLGKQLVSMFTIPGGQLVDASAMTDIFVRQNDSKVTLNGHQGTFDNINELIAQTVSEEIPFINVENGDPYILRALNRTNEEFLEGDPDALGRADLEELYENIQLATEYSNYMNEQTVIVDSNGNMISAPEKLAKINNEYLSIGDMEESDEKESALQEFLENYSFISQKDYVDNLFEEISQQEIEGYQEERAELLANYNNQISPLQNKLTKIEAQITSYSLPTTKKLFYDELQLLEEEKEELQTLISNLENEKTQALTLLDEENAKEIEAIHWQEVFSLAEELQLDEHHYSEDFNKLNSEIAKYNYEMHEENDELLEIDYDEYLDQIAQKMIAVYEANGEDEITKEEAYEILMEIGYEFDEDSSSFEKMFSERKVEISVERFNELLELSGIENPFESFEPIEDAFSFRGKSLNDLQFELQDGNLIIHTFDKDLEEDAALEKSQVFMIEDWDSWDKENSHMELPDGTKVNLQALLELIGVEEGSGLIDVNEAFLSIVSENETIESYLEKYESNRVFVGTSQDDIIKSYFDDNLIVTGEGENSIFTGSGDDIIFADKGTNTISAGLGNDTVSYELSDGAVYASLEDGGTNGVALGDTYEGVENLIGSDFDDSLEGNSEDNTLLGKAGNDILSGGEGADNLDGGEGIDIASYETSDEAVQINLKNDYTYGGEAGGDSLSNIEGIMASQNDDVIVGDSNSNVIYAQAGDDRVFTGLGDDRVYAGSGDDYIKGGEGNDTLYGETGDDILIGGEGDDTLYGGSGENTLLGDKGTDTVVYEGVSSDYQVLFFNENTLFVKSKDGKIQDTLKDIEEIAFDNALFTVDYENKILIRKVTFEGYEPENIEETTTQSAPNENNNQAATIATAIMIGTVAAAETTESSTDEMNYLSDDPASLDELQGNISSEQSTITPVLTDENPLYDSIQLIKEYNQTQNNITILSDENYEETSYQVNSDNTTNDPTEKTPDETTNIEIISQNEEKNTELVVTNEELNSEIEEQDESLPLLINPEIILNQTVIDEDNNLFGIEISNPNSDTTMNVVFYGVPDTFSLSAGEKRSDGNWYLIQEDLQDLQIIPEANNSDDFELTVKAIIHDTHGRVITSEITQTIQIIAVADTPDFEVEKSTFGLEDTAIPLVISASLVDDLGGVDGEESIIISFENLPDDAILSAGVKDVSGIWYLTPEELENLTITPKQHDGDDFTIKVTAYTIESENGDIASVSEDIFVEVYAVADTPELHTSDILGNEDSQIALNISSELIDKDGSEELKIKIENIPDGAVLNHGVKDNEGVWHLLPSELNALTITPSAHDGDDFTIKVTAYTTEEENGEVAQISQDIFVEVNAVADEVILDTLQQLNGRDDLIETAEDVNIILLDLSSTFIDNDGSESVYYTVEGLPEGTSLNNGIETADGTWKVLPEELNGLGMILTPDSDEDFRIKVSAVTTEAENGNQRITSKFLDVAIDSMADYATLSVEDATGMQNDFISLDIESSLTDTDGSETLQIIIEDVPDGAVLNHGIKQTDGSWHLTQGDLKDLTIRPEFDSIDDFEIKVRAITTEAKNGNSAENVANIIVNVEAIPTSVNITVEAAEVLEDHDSYLSINVDESTLHPSESLYLELSIPQNFSLSQGQQLDDTTWKLRTDQLENLSLKTVPNYAGSFSVDIISVIVESTGNERRSEYPVKLPVDIIPVADETSLEVNDIETDEDSLIYLNILSKLNDLDGSESLQLKIRGIPDNSLLNAGEKAGDTWIIQEKDIKTLALLAPENMSGTLELDIESVSTDSNGDTKSITKNITITLNEVVDQPILNVSNSFVKDGESYLAIDSFLQDTDGSESLSIEISGIPDSASLSSGIKTDEGKYILTKEELNDLKISGLDDNVLTLNVKAISSSGMLSEAVEKSIDIHPLEDEENPFVFINNLSITSQTQNGEILEYSGANDVVQSGGGADIINTYGGSDTIEADKASGNITLSFYLEATPYKTDGSESVIFHIENLPEGFVSNTGYINNNILIIENDGFDGNIELSYPYTQETVPMKITANAISNDLFNPYTKSTVLDIDIQVDETAGNDFIDAGDNNDTVYGQDGDDIILGGNGDDLLLGGDGNDYINGGEGIDKIDGGAGDDYIIMDWEDFSSNSLIVETINGGEGFDTLMIQDETGVNFDMGLTSIENFIGSNGADNIIGSENADIIKGGSGADTYYTLDGDDIVYIDAGDILAQSGSFVDTGAGYDKIYIEDSSGVTFDVADTNAEEIISGSGNDILRNTTNENIVIYGMKGNDKIYGSSGTDILDGGEGIDTIDYSNSDFGVTINLETNSVSGGYAQGDTITNFENIIGSSKNDNLTGSNSDNVIFAGDGNNIINGLEGEDTVIFEGDLIDYFNGKDIKNIITDFDTNATVFTDNGINELTNIEKLQFDDYTVYLDGTNNLPFVYNDRLNGTEDNKLIINNETLLENDFDLEEDILKIVEVKNSTNGKVTLNDNGTITFDPNSNYNSSTNNQFDENSALYKGEAGFEYVVEDSEGNRRTAYVDVNISAVNDAPTIERSYFNRKGIISGHGRVIIDDIDSDVSSATISVVSSLIGHITLLGTTNYFSTTLNLSNRTPDDDGIFEFDYKGAAWIGWAHLIYSMRPFVLQITDSGDPLTGDDAKSVLVQSGIYYDYVVPDPVVIDLDGDGIEIDEYYYEKHDSYLTGVGKDDAILVWDQNQDGTISSTFETNWLNLSQTAQNDLDVLREIFDTNQDNIFDQEDEEWENFALWQDKNMDGLVDDTEFTKIADSDILQINLNKDDSQEITYPVEEYASYITKEGEENSVAASYLDITITEDKLSEEDKLILKEAIVLNEQLASVNEVYNGDYEIVGNTDIFYNEYETEENIA